MRKESIVYDKAFSFAVRIVKLYKYLSENKKEFILSKQLIRNGTSDGRINSWTQSFRLV